MKFLRRIAIAFRVSRWKSEVWHWQRVSASVGPNLDRALRELGNARSDLVWLDIKRPPITHAHGLGKREGVHDAVRRFERMA